MDFGSARRLIAIVLGLGAAIAAIQQCRKPRGWLGRRLARAMNLGHARLTAWGLSTIAIAPGARVLDVGCGGGQTVARLAAATPDGRVDGVDYSEASVAVARQTNAALIAAGRVAIQQAAVSKLPFDEATFDLVTAVETHYYWPDLAGDLREVLRVLRPGGRFLLIAETYKGRSLDWLYRPVMRGLLRAKSYLSIDEHRVALERAGFVAVGVEANRSAGWMRAVGVRPGEMG